MGERFVTVRKRDSRSGFLESALGRQLITIDPRRMR